MYNLGFVISSKNNERRRAIMPKELSQLSCAPHCRIESGYGESLHIADREYEAAGAYVLSRADVMQSDIIVDVKLGDADYLGALSDDKLLFGWAHAVQKVDFTTQCINARHTVVAWEEMCEEKRNIFYRNRELAGEASVLHALPYAGKAPYDMKVAVLGRGNTAKGALRVLHGLGAKVDVYGSNLEKLLIQKLSEYDMLVICVMWDTARTRYLLSNEDLKRFKPGAMIVDVSADGDLAVEFGRTTTIDAPVFWIDDVLYYAVDNTPSLFAATATKIISQQLAPILNLLAQGEKNVMLEKATVIKRGEIIDPKIRDYRARLGLG